MSDPSASDPSGFVNLKFTLPSGFGSEPSCQPPAEPISPITHLPPA